MCIIHQDLVVLTPLGNLHDEKRILPFFKGIKLGQWWGTKLLISGMRMSCLIYPWSTRFLCWGGRHLTVLLFKYQNVAYLLRHWECILINSWFVRRHEYFMTGVGARLCFKLSYNSHFSPLCPWNGKKEGRRVDAFTFNSKSLSL